MSAAKLPIPYRDSCAHLLIPLNRCRYEEYYLPWKCEVCENGTKKDESGRLTRILEREAFIRKMPVRRVQGAGQEDGRAESSQERTAKQLESSCGNGLLQSRAENAACIYQSSKNDEVTNFAFRGHFAFWTEDDEARNHSSVLQTVAYQSTIYTERCASMNASIKSTTSPWYLQAQPSPSTPSSESCQKDSSESHQ